MIAEAKRFFSKTWSEFGTDRGLVLVPLASGDDRDGRITRSTIFEAAKAKSNFGNPIGGPSRCALL
jgi:hypothetical protein